MRSFFILSYIVIKYIMSLIGTCKYVNPQITRFFITEWSEDIISLYSSNNVISRYEWAGEWLEIKIDTAEMTYSQEMSTNNANGIYYNETVNINIPKAENSKWIQLIDLLYAKKYIIVFKDANEQWFTAGYRWGTDVRSYQLTENQYIVTFISFHANNLPTFIEENYVISNIINTPPPSASPSNTPSISLTPSISTSRSSTPTPSRSTSNTPSISITPSNTPSISQSRTPSVTPSTTPVETPSNSPTPSVTPTLTSVSPTPSPSPVPKSFQIHEEHTYSNPATACSDAYTPEGTVYLPVPDQTPDVGDFFYTDMACTIGYTGNDRYYYVRSGADEYAIQISSSGSGYIQDVYVCGSLPPSASPSNTPSITPTPSVSGTPDPSTLPSNSPSPTSSVSPTPSNSPAAKYPYNVEIYGTGGGSTCTGLIDTTTINNETSLTLERYYCYLGDVYYILSVASSSTNDTIITSIARSTCDEAAVDCEGM